MDRSCLPSTAFIEPCGSNRPEIERLLRRVLEQVLDYATTVTERSPLPDMPESIGKFEVPELPVAESDILARLRDSMNYSMNAAHPGYMGHMDSIPTTLSVVGDFVAALLNNNMLSVEMSPVFSRIEASLLRSIARLLGLGDQSGGVMVGGGSLANLEALAVARNRHFGCRESGIAGRPDRPVLFASEWAHTSIHKAAMLLGLGTSGVIPIPTDANARMDTEALRERIARARAEGKTPFCVVATVGTTTTGNIDPLGAIAQIARENNLWFHVDAVYGGALALSEELRPRLAGIEDADSITFNPQKWLYVTKTCAMVLFRRFDLLREVFRIPAPYMGNPADIPNLGELSVHGTRHPDVLKLWLSLQHIGRRGYASLIEGSCRLAEFFAAQVRQRAVLELATCPEINLITFRGVPPGRSPEAQDDWNARLQDYLLHEGNAFLSLPHFRGRRWLKAVLLNPFMNEETILALFRRVDAFAQANT